MKILCVIPHHTLLKPEGHMHRLSAILRQLPGATLYFLVPQGAPTTSLNEFTNACVRTFIEPGIGSLRIPYFLHHSADFARSLREAIQTEDIELVLFDFPWGAPIMRRMPATPYIYFSHGVERDFSTITLQHLKLNYWPLRVGLQALIGRIERRTCRQAHTILCISENDRSRFIDKYQVAPTKCLFVPTTCRAGQDYPDQSTLRRKFDLPLDRTLILFHGSAQHAPNREARAFIESQIAPHYATQQHGPLFVFAGNETHTVRWENCISLGYVPELGQLLSACDIALAPIKHGCGVQMKILDYLSSGIPVITTPIGAAGLQLESECTALISEPTGPAMIPAIDRLLEDLPLRRRLATNGKNLVTEQYSETAVQTMLTTVLHAIDSSAAGA